MQRSLPRSGERKRREEVYWNPNDHYFVPRGEPTFEAACMVTWQSLSGAVSPFFVFLHRFIEVAESELIGLHEGNFARYKVRPSEFYEWKQ